MVDVAEGDNVGDDVLEEGEAVGGEGIELGDLVFTVDEGVVHNWGAHLEVIWNIFEEIGGIK